MIKPVVVIGLLGTTLDRGQRAERWNTLAADGGALPARGPARSPLRAAARRAARRAGRRPSRPTSRRSRPRPRCARTSSTSATRGTSRQVYGALHDFARGVPVRPRARGLPGPHHDRHARRADLPVPADRVAALPGAAAADVARRSGTRRPARVRTRIIDLDLSRYDRIASRFQQEQREDLSFLKAGIDTRNAALQRADRAHRAGGDRARARRCC